MLTLYSVELRDDVFKLKRNAHISQRRTKRTPKNRVTKTVKAKTQNLRLAGFFRFYLQGALQSNPSEFRLRVEKELNRVAGKTRRVGNHLYSARRARKAKSPSTPGS